MLVFNCFRSPWSSKITFLEVLPTKLDLLSHPSYWPGSHRSWNTIRLLKFGQYFIIIILDLKQDKRNKLRSGGFTCAPLWQIRGDWQCCLSSEILFCSEWMWFVCTVCLEASGIWLGRSTRAALSWLCQLFETPEGLELISARRAISQCITTLNLEVRFWVCSKQHSGLIASSLYRVPTSKVVSISATITQVEGGKKMTEWETESFRIWKWEDRRTEGHGYETPSPWIKLGCRSKWSCWWITSMTSQDFPWKVFAGNNYFLTFENMKTVRYRKTA